MIKMDRFEVSMDMVSVCAKIRRLAKLDRIRIDRDICKNSLNAHLVSYIEYCGMNLRDYIRDYLSNLQPFMIERLGSEERDGYLCNIDNLYWISLYTNVDYTVGEEVVVFFHEGHKRELAKENNRKRINPIDLIPIIPDSIGMQIGNTENYTVNLLVQCGMLVLPINPPAKKSENGIYFTRYRDIDNPIVDYCNQYITDLYTSDIDLEALDNVKIFSVLNQISYTSYGNTPFSNISLLIDNLAMQNSILEIRAADFALITYVNHLSLDNGQKRELIGIIDDKYKVVSQRGIENILNRVKDCILQDTQIRQVSIDLAQKIIETERKKD